MANERKLRRIRVIGGGRKGAKSLIFYMPFWFFDTGPVCFFFFFFKVHVGFIYIFTYYFLCILNSHMIILGFVKD